MDDADMMPGIPQITAATTYKCLLYFCLIASLSEYVSVYCLVDVESGNLP